MACRQLRLKLTLPLSVPLVVRYRSLMNMIPYSLPSLRTHPLRYTPLMGLLIAKMLELGGLSLLLTEKPSLNNYLISVFCCSSVN